jgi:hypothetical protein
MNHILNLTSRSEASDFPKIEILTDLNTTVHTLYYQYKGRSVTNTVDILTEYQRALEYAKKNSITAVFSRNDLGSLLAAMIAEECNFIGPSVESVFLSLHKQLTKKVANTPVKSELWDITTPFPQQSFPFYLKAPYSSFGSLGFIVRDEKDLEKAQVKIADLLPQMNRPFFSLLEKTGIPKKYPQSLQNCMAIEPLLYLPQVTIEGFVFQGTVYPTIITDTNFQGSSNYFDNFSTPSRWSLRVQEKIKQQLIQDILTIGLNTTFFNAEYWISEDDDKILLIEVNARAALTFKNLYKKTWNYDVFTNIISLALGKMPELPGLPLAVGGQFNIFTKDIQLPEKLHELKAQLEHCKILNDPLKKTQSISDHGIVAAQFELVGDSYQEIFDTAEELRATVSLTPT